MDINDIATFSFLVPITVGARNFFSLDNKSRLLFLYLCVSLVLDLYAWYLSSNSINTMPLFHLHSFIEFTAITIFFYLAIDKKRIKRLVLTSILTFFFLSVLNLVLLESLSVFNSNQRYVECVILCFVFFQFLMNSINVELSLRILIAAFLIYFVGTLLVFILSKELFLGSTMKYVWWIHAVLNIGLNISIAYFLFNTSKLVRKN